MGGLVSSLVGFVVGVGKAEIQDSSGTAGDLDEASNGRSRKATVGRSGLPSQLDGWSGVENSQASLRSRIRFDHRPRLEHFAFRNSRR